MTMASGAAREGDLLFAEVNRCKIGMRVTFECETKMESALTVSSSERGASPRHGACVWKMFPRK